MTSTMTLLDDDEIALPDGSTIERTISACCGAPYPTAITPDGHRVCMGCGDTEPGCDCRNCQNERMLDLDADRYFDQD